MHALVTYQCNGCDHRQEYVQLPEPCLRHECGGTLVEVLRRYETLTLDDNGRLCVEREYYARKRKTPSSREPGA